MNKFITVVTRIETVEACSDNEWHGKLLCTYSQVLNIFNDMKEAWQYVKNEIKHKNKKVYDNAIFGSEGRDYFEYRYNNEVHKVSYKVEEFYLQ